ncbi:unnamed protein product [Meganyctiphanes norvegica]|uniref:RRM domain-containing protein n=1 Tax=Meganyctiphanes norvegica TaxID=48144 RepID=A0AAV2RQ40_MEGNR
MSSTTKKKHVEKEIYEDFSVPGDDLTIVKVVKPRGNNLHQEGDEEVCFLQEESNIAQRQTDDIDQEGVEIEQEIVDIAQETINIIQESTLDISQDGTVDIATTEDEEEDGSAASDSVQEMDQNDGQNDADGQTDQQWWRDRGGGGTHLDSTEKQCSSTAQVSHRPHPYIRVKNFQNLQDNNLNGKNAKSSSSSDAQNVLPETRVESEKKFNQNCRLFVGNIPKDLQEEELKRRFSEYGEIGQFKFNKEGFYAFIGFDYRHNAEKAKNELQKCDILGRRLKIRFAAFTTGVQIKYLSPNVSNELLRKSFATFGDIDICRVLVNERGKPSGEGIVVFSDKKGQSNALQKCREECYFLTKDPRPCIVEPFVSKGQEDGFPEVDMNKNKEYKQERCIGPHFADPYTFEYEIGQRYKKLYDVFKNRRTKLQRDFGLELKNNYRGGGRSDYNVGTDQHIFNYKFAYLNCFENRIREKLAKLTCPQLDLPPMDTTEMKFSSKSRLYIGNLPKGMKEERLTTMCEMYGELGQFNFNEDGCYALVNFDYRKNAEKAKEELQSQQIEGRYLKIHFASVSTGVLVNNLSPHVSNELLEKAFTVFGAVESCKVIVDDRGKPTGEGIVIFIDKKAWSLALKKCMEACYCLTSNPRPCIIEPLQPETDEDQPEITMNRNKYYVDDRSVEPRFAAKDSVEYNHGLKIKRIYDLYNQRKGALEIEFEQELEKLDESKAVAQHHFPGIMNPRHPVRGGGGMAGNHWSGREESSYSSSKGGGYGRGRGHHGRGRDQQYGKGRDRRW